jgi:Ca2+-binding EF-hand superfamily protein
MVKTCSEAILIEIVSEATDPPETKIREALTREELYKIVHTWAEELEFEQICSKNVLEHIFNDFDVDRDGFVSESDLQIKIYDLITSSSPQKIFPILPQS